MSSQYAKNMDEILAALQEPGETPLPDEENIIHAYPTSDGGILLSKRELYDDQTVESQPLEPAPMREPPYFLYFIVMLLVFFVLDVANSQLIAFMTPTATITLTPNVRTVTLTNSMQLGKVLSPITLTESQSVTATGHGHQDARAATGTLTFYNAAFTSQTVNAGTVFTGQDGVQVATDATLTIAANNPPNDGEAHVSAHVLQVGSSGNIASLDINGTFSTALYVRNLAPFANGQDARDYKVVTQADRDTAATNLKAKVTASMTAALQGQLMPGESLQTTPCTPKVSTNHAIGDEADTLEVTVSDSCTAIAYNTQELTTQATKLLTTQEAKTLGQGYTVSGDVQVTVTNATTQQKNVILSFTTQGTYVYQLTTKAQQNIKTLIAGQPRETALRQLVTLPGLSHASISGIQDNQLIPDDPTRIHILIMLTGF